MGFTDKPGELHICRARSELPSQEDRSSASARYLDINAMMVQLEAESLLKMNLRSTCLISNNYKQEMFMFESKHNQQVGGSRRCIVAAFPKSKQDI